MGKRIRTAVICGVVIGVAATSCTGAIEQDSADERHDFREPPTSDEPTNYDEYVDLASATGETPLGFEEAEVKAAELCNTPPQIVDDPSQRPLGDTLIIRVYCPELDLG
jgi:hypothetical protein